MLSGVSGLRSQLTGMGGASSAPVWSPASLSGLVAAPNVALARSLGYLWQDAGKTVPATADTDPVRVMTDPFAPSIDWTAPSNGARPTLRSGSGKWYLAFDGVDDYLAASSTTGWPTGTTSRVYGAAFRIEASPGTEQYVYSTGTGANNQTFALNGRNWTSPFGVWFIGYNNDVQLFSESVNVDSAVTFNYDGTTIASLRNGTAGTPYTTSPALNTVYGAAYIGCWIDSTTRFLNGRFYGAVFAKNQGTGDATLIDTYLRGLMP